MPQRGTRDNGAAARLAGVIGLGVALLAGSAAAAAGGGRTVELILDASGSMNGKLAGGPRAFTLAEGQRAVLDNR